MKKILIILSSLLAVIICYSRSPKSEISHILKRGSFNEFRSIVSIGGAPITLCLFSNYKYDSCGIFVTNDFSDIHSGKWALSNDTLFLVTKERISISQEGEFRQMSIENDSAQYLIKDGILYLIMDSALFKNKSDNLIPLYMYCDPNKIK